MIPPVPLIAISTELSRYFFIWAFWWVAAAAALDSPTAAPMRYIYHPPESNLDRRYVYQWKMLEVALARTEREFGPYTLEPSTFMTERRQAYELEKATGKLSVMYLSPPDIGATLGARVQFTFIPAKS